MMTTTAVLATMLMVLCCCATSDSVYLKVSAHSLKTNDNRGPKPSIQAHASRVLRPVPSDNLPVLPLNYPAHQKPAAPSGTDLDFKRLMAKLGKFYEPAFMSCVRPLESFLAPNGTLAYSYDGVRPKGKVPRELRHLSVRVPGRRRRFRVKGRRNRRKMIRFLSAYIYCPVLYRWKDLGAQFWPRWLREGLCYRDRSCSIPAGMSCTPKTFTHKTLLYWDCRRVTSKGEKCSWIRIQYPVITKCGCACRNAIS